ncbi:MAG: DNA-3-methyladenine glycosylase I [Luteibacter sp.]|jgi:DNA-3-methyladenine glycosylase I
MRCAWAEQSDVERDYHDTEWGVPLHDDQGLFEVLTLRGAQAGLAWRIVLTKRQRYREAFHGYDLRRVAAMTDPELAALVGDRGLIRNRLKIASVRGNARAVLRLRDDGLTLASLLWSFAEAPRMSRVPRGVLPTRSDAADRMCVALRKRGFCFAGKAICHVLMQSAGMSEAHVEGCFRCRP